MKKNIIIAVCGSIASYKSYELVRSLIKKKYSVQVIMTTNAERFVTKLTFQTLTGQNVFSSEWEEGMLHIDIKNMASLYAIVPATANCIGKFANGIADDLVSSTYLAMQCPIILAPAMNPGMYLAPAVQRNLKQLEQDEVQIVHPISDEVICGDVGKGKMASLEDIEKAIIKKIENKKTI